MESSATEIISPPPSRSATPELPPVPPPSPTFGARVALLSRPCVSNRRNRNGQANKVRLICRPPLWGITCIGTYWCLSSRLGNLLGIRARVFPLFKDSLFISWEIQASKMEPFTISRVSMQEDSLGKLKEFSPFSMCTLATSVYDEARNRPDRTPCKG